MDVTDLAELAPRERYPRICVLTGAGISVAAGLGTFRGPDGLWTIAPEVERAMHADLLPDNVDALWTVWGGMRDIAERAGPTPAHRALAEAGAAVITQNIDGLHQKAGNSPERVIELHGNAHELRCVSCGRSWPAAVIHERLVAGEEDPPCEACGGVLRSGTVLFGDPLPPEALDQAVAASSACDVMLIVGSSLVVNPAARLPRIARDRGASLIILNRTETALDALADVHILGEAGPTLSDLIGRLDSGN
jgi:NAD-dependent deacetylase